MAKSKTSKSDILAAIHETVSDYRDAGVIDKQTMRRFDETFGAWQELPCFA